MKPYLNILVGINYTDASRHALAKASEIASIEGAKVTACHVIPLADLSNFVEFYQIEQTNMMKDALQSLHDFVDDVLGADHGVTCKVTEGSPHHEIAAISNDTHIDLLVLGNGENADNQRDHGRFAIRCLRFTNIPVLIVNQATETPLKPIAACLDLSNSTPPILENAARIASSHSPALHLIHACRPPWLQPSLLRYRHKATGDSGKKEQFREVIDGQLSVVQQNASSLISFPIETTRLEAQDPDRALLDHLQSHDFSLIIIGRSGGGLKGFLTDVLGGTAESIIRQARCPVLIVPIRA